MEELTRGEGMQQLTLKYDEEPESPDNRMSNLRAEYADKIARCVDELAATLPSIEEILGNPLKKLYEVIPNIVLNEPFQRSDQPCPAKPLRQPVTYRYDALNFDFIKYMAEVAYYAGTIYGAPEQYTTARLEGEKSPINHIYEHLRQYQHAEPHDHFGDVESHLAVIAYNAMMEYFYHKRFGHKLSVLRAAERI